MKMEVLIHVGLWHLSVDVGEYIDCDRGKKTITSEVNEIGEFHLQKKYLLFPFSWSQTFGVSFFSLSRPRSRDVI